MLKLATSLFIVFSTFFCHAQSKRTHLIISGTLKNESGSKLSNFKILISESQTGHKIRETEFLQSGNFEFELDFDNEYNIEFVKKGYLKKQILVNTFTDKKFRRNSYYEFDALLPKRVHKNLGPQLLNKPVVRIYYNKEKKQFDYDQLYSKKLNEEYLKVSNAEKDKIVKKIEKQLQADSISQMVPVVKYTPEPKEEVKQEEDKNKEEYPTAVLPVEIKKTEVKASPSKTNKNQEIAPVISSKTESLEMRKSIKAVEIQKKEVEALLNLNKKREVTEKLTDFKTYAEIINSKFTLVDYSVPRLKEKQRNNALNESIKAKYETLNPLTSMLDNIDAYEKSQRLKSVQKK